MFRGMALYFHSASLLCLRCVNEYSKLCCIRSRGRERNVQGNHAKYIKSGVVISVVKWLCTMCLLGKTVLIVNGVHRGSTASLVSLDEKSFSVKVDLKDVS